MTTVLVHGSPETSAIWDDLVPHLNIDGVVRLSRPDSAPQSHPALTVPRTTIGRGLPTNSGR